MNFITKSNPLLVLLFSLRLLSNLGNSKIRTKKSYYAYASNYPTNCGWSATVSLLVGYIRFDMAIWLRIEASRGNDTCS